MGVIKGQRTTRTRPITFVVGDQRVSGEIFFNFSTERWRPALHHQTLFSGGDLQCLIFELLG